MTTRFCRAAVLVAILLAAAFPPNAAADVELKEEQPSSVASTPASPPTESATASKPSEKSMLMWIGVGLAAALFVSGIMVTRLRRTLPPPRTADHDGPPFASPE